MAGGHSSAIKESTVWLDDPSIERHGDAMHQALDWNARAKAAYSEGRSIDAELLCRRALRADPTDVHALALLAELEMRRGDFQEGIRLLKQAVVTAGGDHALEYNLGIAYYRAGLRKEAIACLQYLLQRSPQLSFVRAKLAYFYYEAGMVEDAAQVYSDWHVYDPANPEVAHMMHATSGELLPRCSIEYITMHFDKLASQFEKRLVRDLRYRGHEIILRTFLANLGQAEKRRILDAGCGTGLCGPLLRPYASTLTGVDISTEMIKVAETLSVYDGLILDEICRFMDHAPAVFDVIVSSDVFIYFGELADVACAAFRSLVPGGVLIATFENLGPAEAATATYLLGPHGRYCHSKPYVADIFTTAGFEVLSLETEAIRLELGSEVEGLVLVARALST